MRVNLPSELQGKTVAPGDFNFTAITTNGVEVRNTSKIELLLGNRLTTTFLWNPNNDREGGSWTFGTNFEEGDTIETVRITVTLDGVTYVGSDDVY
ncbi:hypothetical protein JCM19039_2926 [Geomicrobium sp. JCM 19039]|nr:hypothetical protein JCM19039_2926 [Geomicrobium sp. JCM 19039]